MTDYNIIFSELAKYTRMQEELTSIIEGLKTELKEYMQENNLETLQGSEHKASYKAVISTRFDSKALKTDFPELVEKYSKKAKLCALHSHSFKDKEYIVPGKCWGLARHKTILPVRRTKSNDI